MKHRLILAPQALPPGLPPSTVRPTLDFVASRHGKRRSGSMPSTYHSNRQRSWHSALVGLRRYLTLPASIFGIGDTHSTQVQLVISILLRLLRSVLNRLRIEATVGELFTVAVLHSAMPRVSIDLS